MSVTSAVTGSRSTNTRSNLTTVLVFLPPALVVFTIFVIIPIGEAAWYGFYRWNGLGELNRYIGLENYLSLLTNKVFIQAAINNVWIIIVSLGLQLPFALAMAVLLADRRWGAVTFRMIFFLPYILADVACGLIWAFMLDGDYGLFSAIIQWFGGQPYFLLADRQWAFTGVLIVIMWKYFGFHMMLYIAGLQQIDRSLYEAAAIDGANAWQRFRFVTLPGLGSMIRLSVFFSLLGSLQFFDMIVALTKGGPLNSTHTMVSFLYYFGIGRMKVGFGSAVGVVLFILCATVAFGYKRIFMKDD
jgi:raffinose/stachyose/melibiose transport system permease protein